LAKVSIDISPVEPKVKPPVQATKTGLTELNSVPPLLYTATPIGLPPVGLKLKLSEKTIGFLLEGGVEKSSISNALSVQLSVCPCNFCIINNPNPNIANASTNITIALTLNDKLPFFTIYTSV